MSWGQLPDGVPVLELVSAKDRKRIASSCRWREFESEASILEAGGEDTDVHFIAKGSVRIVSYSPSGRFVAFAALGPGDFFGELAALDNQPRSATVLAQTAVTIASVPADEFLHAVTHNPSAAAFVMRRLAGIVRSADQRIIDLSFLSASQRVGLELLKMSEPDPEVEGGWRIDPLPTQNSLAATLGVTRETVARIFGKLQETSIIERRSGSVLRINNRHHLERLAVTDIGEGTQVLQWETKG